jgi:hypothetical protein
LGPIRSERIDAAGTAQGGPASLVQAQPIAFEEIEQGEIFTVAVRRGRASQRDKGDTCGGFRRAAKLNRVVADHLFRIVSQRYERGSMIVTSNKPFEQWAEMFVDPILANAALDRLIHHAHVVPIAGESYRMKDRRPPPPPGGKGPRGTKPPS